MEEIFDPLEKRPFFRQKKKREREREKKIKKESFITLNYSAKAVLLHFIVFSDND